MLVVVGRLGRAHGIRGDIACEVRTDEPERRFAEGACLLADDGRAFTVESARWHSGRLLLRLVGIEDRTAAEALTGLVVECEVPADEVPEGPEEYYDRQLVGLAAETTDGAGLGIVKEVLHLPGHDVLAVLRPDGTDALIPFVTEVVPVVDLVAGRLVVSPPPGLLEGDHDGRLDPAGGE